MSAEDQLQEAANKATQASEQANTWAFGPENAAVPTDSGPVPTIAEFTRASKQSLENQLKGMGYTRVGTFASGATIDNARQTLLWELSSGGDGQEYGWTGTFPKVVPPGSTPNSTGGISAGAWVSRYDPVSRVQVMEIVKRSYAEAGFESVFSFEAGGTVSSLSQVLIYEADGVGYLWMGALPKTVPPGSTPSSSGGIGTGAWEPKNADLLRSDFKGIDGTGLDNFYGGGGWTGSDSAFWNFYPGNAGANSITNALRWRYSVPVTNNPSPVVWVEKKSSVTREDGVQRWDSGVIYGGLIKESGTAFGAAVTGAVKYSGGSGDAIAMHGRVLSQATGSSGFAGWFMHSAAASGVARAVAVEMDVQNFNDQLLWRETGGPGHYTVLNLTSSSGTHGVHEYIRVPGKPPESGQQAYTGIFIGLNTIFPTDANDNGEAMRIRGSSFSGGRYGGIAIGDAFDSHFMSFGLRMINAQFTSNRAIQMADGHRIYWGASLGTGSGKWIEGLTGNLLNCQNLSLAMNGTKVVGARRTGWTQSTGTATRTGFSTSTATTAQVAEALKALIDDLFAHGLIGA